MMLRWRRWPGVDGRVAVFLEPIALYMSKDLHEPGDGQWLFDYPGQEPGTGAKAVFTARAIWWSTYGKRRADGVARSASHRAQGWQVRVVDLRWLVPLDAGFIAARRQRTAGAGAGRGPAQWRGEGGDPLVEAGFGHLPLRRVCGADTSPLAGAAMFQATMR